MLQEIFSPTYLCGVLVFDSESVPSASASTASSFTHIFVTHHLTRITHHLSYTTLSHTHTIFHTQLCHTHHLSHTSLSHAISHAGVALGDLHLRFAWHLATSTFVSRDRRGTYGTRLALVVCWWLLGRAVTPRHFPWQAALGDIHRRFAWQAWHLATTTVLRGRRLTYGTGLALVARLGPLGRAVTPRHFAWQAALGDIYRRFVWQAFFLLPLHDHLPFAFPFVFKSRAQL